MSKNHPKLHIWAFGLAFGVTWAIGVLLLGWLAAFLSWGFPIVDLIGSGYLGYSASFLGAFIGAIWAFADGFIFGVIIAAFYNLFMKWCK